MFIITSAMYMWKSLFMTALFKQLKHDSAKCATPESSEDTIMCHNVGYEANEFFLSGSSDTNIIKLTNWVDVINFTKLCTHLPQKLFCSIIIDDKLRLCREIIKFSKFTLTRAYIYMYVYLYVCRDVWYL